MNIYQIKWDIEYVSSGAHGLCATVIAQNEADAIKSVELEDESVRNIQVWLIGTTTDTAKILCRECL